MSTPLSSGEIVKEVHRIEEQKVSVPASPDSPFNKHDVVYGKVGTRELKGILFEPRKPSKSLLPAVVYIHGGGWTTGTLAQFTRHAAAMTEKGFVGLCIQYRLSGETPYPAAVEDSRCAVRFLRAHAKEFNIDPKRIGAVGGSAGAHLSALLATTPNRKEWDAEGGHFDYSSAIQAAVLFNGEFDLPQWWKYEKCNDFMLKFLGTSYEQDSELYRLVSPITHVSEQTAPCLMMHGEEDVAVPISQSVEFYDALCTKGVSAELLRVSKVGHGWFNSNRPHFESCLQYMMAFLVRYLGTSV
jgi:acetyl esterase/lipase